MELKKIEITKIKANPSQPRVEFDQIEELAASIKEVGILNPIIVRQTKSGYEIVAGERRYRAAKKAKLKSIRCLIKEYRTDGQVAIESLIENVHRADLNPIEKSKFLMKIKQIEYIKTNSELARRVGMSPGAIENALKYLKLDCRVIDKVSAGTLDSIKARSLSDLKKEDQVKVAKKAENLTWRQTEKLVSLHKKASEPVKEAILKDKITVDEAEDIMEISNPTRQEQALHSTIRNKKDSASHRKYLKDKAPIKPQKEVVPTKEEVVNAAFDEMYYQINTKSVDIDMLCRKVSDWLEQVRDTEIDFNGEKINFLSALQGEHKGFFKKSMMITKTSLLELIKEIDQTLERLS